MFFKYVFSRVFAVLGVVFGDFGRPFGEYLAYSIGFLSKSWIMG